jgi:hypothetical protein
VRLVSEIRVLFLISRSYKGVNGDHLANGIEKPLFSPPRKVQLSSLTERRKEQEDDRFSEHQQDPSKLDEYSRILIILTRLIFSI